MLEHCVSSSRMTLFVRLPRRPPPHKGLRAPRNDTYCIVFTCLIQLQTTGPRHGAVADFGKEINDGDDGRYDTDNLPNGVTAALA